MREAKNIESYMFNKDSVLMSVRMLNIKCVLS